MRILARPMPIFAFFILISFLNGSAVMAAESKSFKGVGDTCVDAKRMARRAARQWRADHCKGKATTSYKSSAGHERGNTPTDAEQYECDQESNGKFSILRHVDCSKGQGGGADGQPTSSGSPTTQGQSTGSK
jgi:hypothetical protein